MSFSHRDANQQVCSTKNLDVLCSFFAVSFSHVSSSQLLADEFCNSAALGFLFLDGSGIARPVARGAILRRRLIEENGFLVDELR